MYIFEVWDQEYILYLKVYQYSVWKRFSCKRTRVFEILLIQRQDMGRTEDRACSFKSDKMVSSPAPSLSYQSRTQIWRQIISFGGLGISVCLHCPLHSGVFLFQTYRLFLYLLSQCDNFFVQLVLRSSLPLEPVGYSYWCNCSCNFCAGLRNTVHYLLRNHCC